MPKSLIKSVITQLQKERHRLENELQGITAALTAFGKSYLTGGAVDRKKRTMSAAGRRRIAAAQRARWAKARGQANNSTAPKKRTMSAAARARISAAQRARWAKQRKAQK